MCSDGGDGPVGKAARKAASEVSQAAAVIGKGCDPVEALATKVGGGPEDLIDAFNEANRKNRFDPSNKPEMLAFRIDDCNPLMHFRVSSCGKYLLPIAQDIIPMLASPREKMDLKSSDKEVRKQRNDVAKAESNLMAMLKPAKEIQSLIKYPGSAVPHIAKAITPGMSVLSFIPSVVTLGVIGFMKRYYKSNAHHGR